MINAAVRMLQEKLAALGYDIGASGADGVVGRKTRAAISAFQARTGLPVTGLATDATLTAIGKASVPPKPQMRPAPDQLGSGNAGTMPRLRPPPEQLGQGYTNRLPNLRPDQTPGLPMPNGGPPMAAGGGFGAFTPTPQSTPGVPAGVGLNFDAMRRLDATAGARGIEAKQRFMAPVAQGGMGQPNFPQMSQYPMTGNGVPVASAGGNLGNDMPLNAPQMASGANPPMPPPQMPPQPQVPQQASAGGAGMFGGLAGAFAPPPPGWQPTADQPGYGIPGQAPNPSFLGAVGDSVRGAAGAAGNFLGAVPGNAGNAMDWVLSNNLKGVNSALGAVGLPNIPGSPTQPPTDFTPPPQPSNPGLQGSLDQAAAKEQLRQMLWQMLIGQPVQPTQAPWIRSDQSAPATPPPPPYGSPMGAYR